MWHRIYALIVKELLASARDPQTRWVVLFSPPFLLLIYAFAITQEVSDVTLAVYNQDQGNASVELISRFKGATVFDEILHLRAEAEIARAIDTRRATLVLRVGEDFSRRLERGENAQVQLILDGRRSNTAQILLGYSSRIVKAFNEDRLRQLGRVPPIRLVQRTWFNPNLEPLWSAVPALFAVLVAVVGFMVSALSIARERELGTFEQLLVSPLRPFEILVGKSVPALLIALTSASAMLVLGLLFLNVPIRGSLALLFIGMVMYLSAIIGIGLFISSLAKTQQQAIIGLFMYMVPAVLISGYATPVENMPDWLQGIATTIPITHFIVISKAVYLREAPLWLYFSHIWPLAVIAAVSLSAAIWLFRRRTG
ncbi:ABC transporter permease [Erythrobacter sp. SN021]|uniref:ABC transporter permease n=1 Tax=Erythrobacter sp. SN021 TaxID=2912574 RepID=UPI001F3478EE|nr:ABC transporter permease [Erythrobacter sp. SN021]MCF8882074.1 ABC transporter permease [Erythrobacter sp. SN021]